MPAALAMEPLPIQAAHLQLPASSNVSAHNISSLAHPQLLASGICMSTLAASVPLQSEFLQRNTHNSSLAHPQLLAPGSVNTSAAFGPLQSAARLCCGSSNSFISNEATHLFLFYFTTLRMPEARVNTDFETPNVDVLIDLGHPLLNRMVDGFVKVGGVGALHAASQDATNVLLSGETNKKSFEHMAQRMGKEAVQWGLVAGIYSGTTYGMQEARGVHDWKNALLGGALTGVALSLTEPNVRSDGILLGAITGGAVATAAEFLRNIT
ncbi:hypothetical protein L7F22_016289 [Adiantum nelumboides]|nr:hypothetical protein [Adiantum nelumboides]